MRTEYLLAWLLPLLAGGSLAALCGAHDRGPGAWARWLGAGWLVGVVLAALLASWLAADATPAAFTRAAPWLAGLALTAGVAALIVRRRTGPAPRGPERTANLDPTMVLLATGLLAALILLRLGMLAWEAALRPVFPWDAWTAWSLKAKTWVLHGSALPFVAPGEWLGAAELPARTVASWSYPDLLAWIQVWFASGAGGWNEPLVGLAWSGALAALALACYGYWRGLGLQPVTAMVFVYALVSLPLLGTHAALAGYADLWMAALQGAAVLAWVRWLETREPGQWLLAVALALCLPMLKAEGGVWMLILLAMFIYERLRPCWRWRLAAALGLGVALLAWLRPGPLPAGALGSLDLGSGSLRFLNLDAFQLRWHASGGAVRASLFSLSSWHLLWYVFPALLLWRWRTFAAQRSARLLGGLLLLQALFLFVLFFLTNAAAWADNFTSINRLLLHTLPGVFTLCALLLRSPDAGARTACGRRLQLA